MAKVAVTTNLTPGDADWLRGEALRIGVSQSRILADLVADYRATLAAVDRSLEAACAGCGRTPQTCVCELISEQEWLEEDTREDAL